MGKSINKLLSSRQKLIRSITKNWQLYIFVLPALAYFIVFSYIPMYGLQIAFKDFSPKLGIMGSPWAVPPLKHFITFISSYSFPMLLRNTLTLSVYGLLAGFPLPVLLAIMINEVNNSRFKKIVQNITYAPHFISLVVMIGMLNLFFSYTGIVNQAIAFFGFDKIHFLQEDKLFKHLYVWSGIWQGVGYSSIIYIAALSGVPPELHEAAIIDGATKLKRIWYINLPHIKPTIVIMLILGAGGIMSVGYEKVFLMQNTVNLNVSEVISTYVYNLGIVKRNYSFSSAIGLFNNIINLVLVLIVNGISRMLGDDYLI